MINPSPYEKAMNVVEWYFSKMILAENESEAMKIAQKMMTKCHRLIKEKPQGVGILEQKSND